MLKAASAGLLALLFCTPLLWSQSVPEDLAPAALGGVVDDELLTCLQYGPPLPLEVKSPAPAVQAEPGVLDRLSAFSQKYKLRGLASYYSTFFDGRQTANGEIYRNATLSAAHLTLPLGTWVEIRSVATGRKLRLRVNDRGPYTGGFVIDLSQAAARALGVDRAADRRVEIRLLALPGEAPPPAGDIASTTESLAAK